ncbi:NAD(P)H-binding protein [Haladaptatus sp. DYF46]|uniref:NAD(P)-dependent oxidoreductase n=1 Tax=Haladaptatus sp. DYF46 TaxID=2886041 RepID=UPI001E60691F|nr:NAD(P)H-binding protein [Haladaptatus sp. DYF46]
MEVVVFGATGRVGRHVVDTALLREHEVRAFVRSPEKVDPIHCDNGHLSIVEGDVLDTDAVERAVRGADVVLSALGPAKGSPVDVAIRGGKNIFAAMRTHDVPRVVILGGRVISHPKDPFSVSGRILSSATNLVASDLIEGGERFMRTLAASDYEWVMVRPPWLRSGPRTRDYRTGYLKLTTLSTVSRATVAAFMVRAAETDRWVGEAPMIAN